MALDRTEKRGCRIEILDAMSRTFSSRQPRWLCCCLSFCCLEDASTQSWDDASNADSAFVQTWRCADRAARLPTETPSDRCVTVTDHSHYLCSTLQEKNTTNVLRHYAASLQRTALKYRKMTEHTQRSANGSKWTWVSANRPFFPPFCSEAEPLGIVSSILQAECTSHHRTNSIKTM